MQSWEAVARSMYWPSQKRAPWGDWQSAWQSGGSTVALQLAWHMTLACTWHEASQLAVHCASQVAEGGVAWQEISQRLLQSAMQAASQVEPSPVQLSWQLPSHDDSHSPVQVNVPGWAMQVAVQSVWQLPVHDAEAIAEHRPSHSAEKLPGVHWATHCAGVTTY
jgi:hypothetical protein